MNRLFSILCGIALLATVSNTAFAETKKIDNFRGDLNLIGGRSSVYQQEPSRIMYKSEEADIGGNKTRALVLKYDKKNTGGPYDSGGWCGYYTLLKVGNLYFDASAYKSITFWVKGAKGDENFRVGVSDRQWDTKGDSVKSGQIGEYLKDGKITTQWQKATVPLDSFLVDMKEMAAISICFEGDCFPDGKQMGTVYIAEIALE